MFETPIPITSRDVNAMTRHELLGEMAYCKKFKLWGTRYFQLDREIQRRAVANWVHEDVFGNTHGDGSQWQ